MYCVEFTNIGPHTIDLAGVTLAGEMAQPPAKTAPVSPVSNSDPPDRS